MIIHDEHPELWRTNRVRKTEPLQDKPFWCYGCDRDLVREGERCGTCGMFQKSKHFRLRRTA